MFCTFMCIEEMVSKKKGWNANAFILLVSALFTYGPTETNFVPEEMLAVPILDYKKGM